MQVQSCVFQQFQVWRTFLKKRFDAARVATKLKQHREFTLQFQNGATRQPTREYERCVLLHI
jgi:hypothetical protein